MEMPDELDITRDLRFEYSRLPDRTYKWRQWKVYQDEEVLVTAFHDPGLERPIKARGEVVIDKVLNGISYNFWDQWFNVIRIYDRDLVFKGYYTDILTPIQKTWNLVTATDLFLDFYMFPDGTWSVEDEDEFGEALERGVIDEGIAARARETLDMIVERAEDGNWPPDCVNRVPADPVRELRAVAMRKLP